MPAHKCQTLPAEAPKASRESPAVARREGRPHEQEPKPEAESPLGNPREPESEPESPSCTGSPRRPRRKEVVTIFDWDDTLLCTSYLKAYCKEEDEQAPGEVLPTLRSIEASAKRLLQLAARGGRCIIVTNSVEGWVEYSAEKYLPSVREVLCEVRIISARSKYSEAMPGQANEWKVQAFRDICKELGDDVHLHLTAIGDSDLEMRAAHVVRQDSDQVVLKTIKLQELPSPWTLAKELFAVSRKFAKILSAPCDLSISLCRKWAGATA